MGARPFRISLPAGLATAVGALPQVSARDWSAFSRELMPHLLSAHAVNLDAGSDADRGTAAQLRPVAEFLETMADRVEPVVLSLTGPISLTMALAEAGRTLDDAVTAASDRVRSVADSLLNLSGSLVPSAPILLFLDEPRLANSMHPTFPLGSDTIRLAIDEVVDSVDERAAVGVTVGGRADWAMLMSTGIAVLGAPLAAGLESAAGELSAFFERGGFVAWAAVPTDEPLGAGTDRLWRRLSAAWSDLARCGVDPLALREHSIITPAAGLGSFGVAQAELVLNLAAGLSQRVMNQLLGARLSVGA